MWRNVQVHPWIGEKYWQPDLLPYRTAILGESNYTKPELFNENLVVQCVRHHLGKNDEENFSRFATKTRRLVFDGGDEVDREAFWSNVAFYNFIQELVGDAARQRPEEDMWHRSVAALAEVVAHLQPERLWVLGKANWLNLLRQVDHTLIDTHTASLRLGPSMVTAFYTNHPSSGLAYATWRPVVAKALLAKDTAQ